MHFFYRDGLYYVFFTVKNEDSSKTSSFALSSPEVNNIFLKCLLIREINPTHLKRYLLVKVHVKG